MIKQENNIQSCPLCNSSGEEFYSNKRMRYYECTHCHGIFMDKESRPDEEAEIIRYKEHNNDVEDERYQAFVSPITAAIKRNFNAKHTGLDFGAGTAPVISKVLTDSDFDIVQYDPFFHNHPHLLRDTYDYIACCEVIEHFYSPEKEFRLLKELLKPNGKLYCMTDIYNKSIDFHSWYYKNDNTHVFIYQKETFDWIKAHFGFSKVEMVGRLVTLSN
jgi:SAM-dependent methyltransferase